LRREHVGSKRTIGSSRLAVLSTTPCDNFRVSKADKELSLTVQLSETKGYRGNSYYGSASVREKP
jgi:hypothetical protein